MDYFWVGLGGALGAVARYTLGKLISQRAKDDFPWGTLLVNWSGAFLLTFFLAVGLHLAVPVWNPLMATGFVGAYTTFSTFTYETMAMVADGENKRAFTYVFLSLAGGLFLGWLGIVIGNIV